MTGALGQVTPGEPEYPPARSDQPVLPLAVALEAIGRGVIGPSVDLDHQPFPVERDIGDPDNSGVVADRDIHPPARDAAVAKQRGEPALGLRSLSAGDEGQQRLEALKAATPAARLDPPRELLDAPHATLQRSIEKVHRLLFRQPQQALR
jgi:hypothetical protein